MPCLVRSFNSILYQNNSGMTSTIKNKDWKITKIKLMLFIQTKFISDNIFKHTLKFMFRLLRENFIKDFNLVLKEYEHPIGAKIFHMDC